MQRRKNFNLVEIILALGIILIGVVSLMGLFPAAAKVTTDAAMETYASNAMEELAAFIADSATRDWETWISKKTTEPGDAADIPNDEPSAMLKPGADETKTGNAEEHEEEVLSVSNTIWNWVDKELNPYLFKHQTKKGVYMLISVRGQSLEHSFGSDNTVKRKDTFEKLEDVQDNIDSRVLITVWKTRYWKSFKGEKKDEDDYTNVDKDYEYGVRLNMKAAWPAERPECRWNDVDGNNKMEKTEVVPLRQIKVMTFDLHKPQE